MIVDVERPAREQRQGGGPFGCEVAVSAALPYGADESLAIELRGVSRIYAPERRSARARQHRLHRRSGEFVALMGRAVRENRPASTSWVPGSADARQLFLQGVDVAELPREQRALLRATTSASSSRDSIC